MKHTKIPYRIRRKRTNYRVSLPTYLNQKRKCMDGEILQPSLQNTIHGIDGNHTAVMYSLRPNVALLLTEYITLLKYSVNQLGNFRWNTVLWLFLALCFMYSGETNGLKNHIKDDFYQGLVCSECALQQKFFENKKF